MVLGHTADSTETGIALPAGDLDLALLDVDLSPALLLVRDKGLVIFAGIAVTFLTHGILASLLAVGKVKATGLWIAH